MTIPIVFEDNDLLIVDKPAGLVVNRAESVKVSTVQDWVDERYTTGHMPIKNSDEFSQRSGIVHRIDKETTGLLVIAKTPDAFGRLQSEFADRIVKKTYLAIVHGSVAPREGEIRAPVGRLPWNRQRFGVVPEGKEATTSYEVVQEIASPMGSEVLTLVAVRPVTGRTHQIRVHLTYIHHPILGDSLYGGRKRARDDRTWVPRVMLHAWKLALVHPKTAELLAFEAPVPHDMKRIIDYAASKR